MTVDNSFDPEQRRRDALTEGSGFSKEMTDVLRGDIVLGNTTELPRFQKSAHRPRPLGRAAVDGSGVEESRRLANKEALEHPVDPAQPHINARGRALVEAALDESFGKDRKIQLLIDKVEKMIPIDPDDVEGSLAARERQTNALLRSHFDAQH